MHLKPLLFPFCLLICLMVAACAAGPRFSVEGVDTAVSPREALKEAERLRGTAVLWGGLIVQTENLADRTRIEVLGYPLDSNQRPDTGRAAQGRFLVMRDGYLEPSDYAQGRAITVSGRLLEPVDGRVGEAAYRYPVVTGDQLYLWPRRSGYNRTGVHFGIGVIFSN